jgi:transcriptional regulator with XRE-family HTH domain
VAAARPSKLRRVFADRVRARRKELNLSQEELADRAEVHRTFIGHVERAETNISIDNIARISEALGVPAFELLRPD